MRRADSTTVVSSSVICGSSESGASVESSPAKMANKSWYMSGIRGENVEVVIGEVQEEYGTSWYYVPERGLDNV